MTDILEKYGYKKTYLLRKSKKVNNTGDLNKDIQIIEKKISHVDIPKEDNFISPYYPDEKKPYNIVDLTPYKGYHSLPDYIPIKKQQQIENRYIDGTLKPISKTYTDSQFFKMYNDILPLYYKDRRPKILQGERISFMLKLHLGIKDKPIIKKEMQDISLLDYKDYNIPFRTYSLITDNRMKSYSYIIPMRYTVLYHMVK